GRRAVPGRRGAAQRQAGREVRRGRGARDRGERRVQREPQRRAGRARRVVGRPWRGARRQQGLAHADRLAVTGCGRELLAIPPGGARSPWANPSREDPAGAESGAWPGGDQWRLLVRLPGCEARSPSAELLLVLLERGFRCLEGRVEARAL